MCVEFKKWQIAVCMITLLCFYSGTNAQPQVPCYFIFGDSLVDNGNNNAIASLARANYLPYGVDFPEGPTGRFCNGKTTVDVIGKDPLKTSLQYVHFAGSHHVGAFS